MVLAEPSSVEVRNPRLDPRSSAVHIHRRRTRRLRSGGEHYAERIFRAHRRNAAKDHGLGRQMVAVAAAPWPGRFQRYELVLSTSLGSLLGLLLLVAALLTGTFIGVLSGGLGDSVDAGPFLLIGVNSLCLAAAILGYSYLISALSSDGGRAVLLSTALSVAFFFLDYMSGLFDVLGPVGRASVFPLLRPRLHCRRQLVPGLAHGDPARGRSDHVRRSSDGIPKEGHSRLTPRSCCLVLSPNPPKDVLGDSP